MRCGRCASACRWLWSKAEPQQAEAEAAASHTGSLATDDRVFDGMCRQAGAVRAASIEEAFDTAAAFATQPLPGGPGVVVMTTVGGWGVMTADAMATTKLELTVLPDDLLASLDGLLPARWSRNNPVDLAGGETKDTIPAVVDLLASHDAVDSVVVLGMGIQSNQGRMEREGGFYPDWGLERIVDFHDRQDGSVLPRRLPKLLPPPANPSWSPPNSPWPTPTTLRWPVCAQPGGTASHRRSGRCGHSPTCWPGRSGWRAGSDVTPRRCVVP